MTLDNLRGQIARQRELEAAFAKGLEAGALCLSRQMRDAGYDYSNNLPLAENVRQAVLKANLHDELAAMVEKMLGGILEHAGAYCDDCYLWGGEANKIAKAARALLKRREEAGE